MRKRPRYEEDHDSTDRWLISYSDFLTLMFTFFAALYALSSVDKEKVGKFSTSLRQAFNVIEAPVPALAPDAQKQMVRDLSGKFANIDGITVKSEPRGVVITMASDIAFVSGSADLKESMDKVLVDVAKVLNTTPGRIVVEGHADNVPLTGTRYKSNWELSTSRAASVLHTFIQHGIEPGRLIVAGYGEYRPVETNETAEGRSKNRRVEIVFAPANLK